MKWFSAEDTITRANDTDTGLAASVWSRDMVQAEHIASHIQTGTL
jgi:acyl-CoA reductase-like NAD-dependent aldehyde dehydrogenase